MEAPGRVRGMRRRHEPRGQPHFVLPPNLYMGPPVGGTFWFRNFILASSPEIWRKTISGGEGGPGGEMGWPVFGLPPWKKFSAERRRLRRRKGVHTGSLGAARAYPTRCATCALPLRAAITQR